MINKSLPLVLASASPSRLSLLKNSGFKVDKVITVDIDESSIDKENPKHYVLRVTRDKMKAAALMVKNAIVITADTTTVCGGKIFHKTNDDQMLRYYCKLSSGRRHTVYTAVCCAKILDGKIVTIKEKIACSMVQFRKLTEAEIEHFIHSQEGRGKSGGYSILGIASRYIKFMRGTHSNVAGLPMYETTQLLKAVGYSNLTD
jgi:septum formation protein